VNLVDTHCHLNFDAYDADRQQVIDRAASTGVTRIIIPGVDLPSIEQALALSSQFQGIYAAVGIHPNSSSNFDAATLEEIERLAHKEKVVSIGEIGLDYYWDKSPRERQINAFEAQLDLASRLQLPVIIHNRDASDDVIAVLENWAADLPPSLKGRPGVLHSFSASVEISVRALALGFCLGFTGPITYKNAGELRTVARETPLDRILVETDGPFLSPVPYRGKRNEPAYIPYIVERLASLKQMTDEDMGTSTTRNAVHLFGLRQ
jgi:TatD DNase family protein